jgi:HEAT repeat protein
MRTLIAVSTFVGVLTIGTLEADVPKIVDVPKQIAALKGGKTARERATAAEEIGRYGAIRGAAVKDAIEPLLDALKNDSEASVRSAAATALGAIGPEPKTTVPALTEALKDSSASVKIAAALALGQFGPDARPSLSALRELAANKKDKKISMAARTAVKSISGKKN